MIATNVSQICLSRRNRCRFSYTGEWYVPRSSFLVRCSVYRINAASLVKHSSYRTSHALVSSTLPPGESTVLQEWTAALRESYSYSKQKVNCPKTEAFFFFSSKPFNPLRYHCVLSLQTIVRRNNRPEARGNEHGEQ